MLDNFGNIGKWPEFDENTIKVGKFTKILRHVAPFSMIVAASKVGGLHGNWVWTSHIGCPTLKCN
jgi:hypothetical protein